MLSRIAVSAAMIATAALSAQAGEIKIHDWPMACTAPDTLEVEIPVTMDIQPYLRVWPTTIRLRQAGVGTYEGCQNLRMRCNCHFHVTLTCSITPTGAVPGQYSCSITSPVDIDPPGGSARLCVRLTDAQLQNQPPRYSVKVAVVKVTVIAEL